MARTDPTSGPVPLDPRRREIVRRLRGTHRRAIALACVLVVAASHVAGAAHTDPQDPNDPLYAHQWGAQQINVEEAWDHTRGSGAVIAVVDTGIDFDHEDLGGQVIGGRTFLDCGDAGCDDGHWSDGHPHGTHVAGIVAAVANNGIGIAGIAPQAKLLSVRALDDRGAGTTTDIARGIRWAADRGAHVINLSLGGPPWMTAIQVTGLLSEVSDAIAHARNRGSVVVASAGNDALPLCSTPGSDPGALCVTATDRFGLRADYSNHPVNRDLLSVAAPGGSLSQYVFFCAAGIVSTVPAGQGHSFCGYPSERTYAEYVGTSMAAPHVSGAAALLAARGCSANQILTLLTSTARHPSGVLPPGTWTPVYGSGIVDAGAAVAGTSAVCT